MKYECKDIGLRIVIDDKLMAKLFRLGSKYYPKEYGGLLVGRYENNNTEVIIEDTVLPKQFKSSAISFERGVQGLRAILQKFFNKVPSLIYVGEWHTHPNGQPIPSATDSSALREIAAHYEVAITNPILLIIGIRHDHHELAFFVLYQNKIHRYEMDKEPIHESKIN